MSEIPDVPVDEGGFTYKLPVCVILEKITGGVHASGWNLQFHNLLTLDSPLGVALAVFTDRPQADEFREKHASNRQVMEVPTPASYWYVLRCVTGLRAIIYDPVSGTNGFHGHLVPLATVLRDLESGGEPPPTDS